MGIIKRVVEHYGKDKQLNVCIEELSELIKELCKDKRGQGNPDHIAEEMADVRIIMAQLDEIYQNTAAVAAWTNTKMQRLEQRLEQDQQHSYKFYREDVELYRCTKCGESRAILHVCPKCRNVMERGDDDA
jgi:rubrerythrin